MQEVSMFFKRFSLFLALISHPASAQEAPVKAPSIADYEKLVSGYRYYKPDSAIFFAQKAIGHARKTSDSNGVARMLNQLGMIDDNLGRYNDARKKYLTSLELFTRLGDKKGMAAENIRLGVVELRKGSYDKAIGYFLQALKISEQAKNTPGMMEAYITLGEAYLGQQKYDTAINYLKTAEGLNDILPFSSLTLNLYNDFGAVYRQTGNFPLAEAYLRKGIGLSNKPELQGLFITLTNNLAALYNRKGLKKESIALQLTALQRAREIKNYIRELQVLTSLADTYGQDNAARSLSYLEEALALARDKNAHKQEIDLLDRLSKLYRFLGRQAEALKMKEMQYELADSFFYRNMTEEIANLQAAYELDKSKAHIKELKYVNNRQQLEGNVSLGITAGMIVLLAVVATFYYRTRKLNNLLNKLNTQLVESNSVKDKLFSILGHDLRAPISSIISLLYLVNEDDLSADERKDVINRLAVSSNASLETLNKLLKWGETQIKGILLNPMEFRPKEVIARTIALLSVDAEKKSITIEDLSGENETIFADPDHFEFVMRNLISNAIKFTPEQGSVTVSTSHELKNCLTFHVKDTGVGIDPARIPNIFTLANTSTKGTNNEKGTSLGLVMCKEFIEANHGKISATSEPGQGTEFIFSLRT
ncbi:tetratricopeptide repeat-containing sensor histidine kinase [Hufsiella ginkgonis]|uniref:histidine kinase n=1 Tax=Hufsiella ginkgonis TaxID=2695274 RepID=A0A7K1XY10_9SPHI|nr:tetratricopeptide repeat protein [Hufsiella ginkgonis]MXV15416.1 tetratricopeptide repeat protein [Hufsiella ginkgonis]